MNIVGARCSKAPSSTARSKAAADSATASRLGAKQHGNGGEQNVPFYLIRQPFDLIADHQILIAAIRDELGKAAPAVIVIDTLNRAMGGGDENKSDDMGKFIKALGAVQAAFDCLILVVHHCGIVGTRPRGHTSLAGADDVQIRIERDKDGAIKATVEHAKDFEAGAVLASKLDRVELGTDSDGDAITSCVIIAERGQRSGTKAHQRTSNSPMTH